MILHLQIDLIISMDNIRVIIAIACYYASSAFCRNRRDAWMEKLFNQGRIREARFNPFEKKEKWFWQTKKTYKSPEALSQILESKVMNHNNVINFMGYIFGYALKIAFMMIVDTIIILKRHPASNFLCQYCWY